MKERESSPLVVRSPEERALDAIVAEAKAGLETPAIDWAALEARLMSEVESSRPLAIPPKRSRYLQLGAIALAAAAGFLVIVRRDRETVDASVVPTAPPTAGALRGTEGVGEVRIGGLSAPLGQIIHGGDVIETEGARALFERPRKVTWFLESEHGVARARVKSAVDALVLALDDGSIEAQVVPVQNGEAFAVDVAAGTKLVRIAVHGTHLRVTRNGDKVAIDLTEGVVSIGVPPRSGSTYGTLVTAPAHVELDVNDLDGSLKVDHTQAQVRTAIALPHVDPPLALAKDAPQNTPLPKSSPVAAPKAPDAPSKVEGPKIASRDAVVQAVKDCAAAKGRSGEVKVTLTSTLRLKVLATGEIQSATFEPPLQPEIQACAAAAIYKVKLEEGGALSLPIELTY